MRTRNGFTLVELLVVIGIIALLVGIVVPTISKVREAAQVASTGSFLQQLSGAIENYAAEQGGYPGPLADRQIGPNSGLALPAAPGNQQSSAFLYGPITADATFGVTGTENLVLGLLGGLASNNGTVYYRPDTVGQGPVELRNSALNKRFQPYFTPREEQLSWRTEGTAKTGKYLDDGGPGRDTIIPEFVDNFASAMPILYLRAHRGIDAVAGVGAGSGQYTIHQVIGYTDVTPGNGTPIGLDRTAPPDAANNFHGLNSLANPADEAGTVDSALTRDKTYGFTAYFTDPDRANQPRQKDGFILISAGPDRIYGTRDDITNFGGF